MNGFLRLLITRPVLRNSTFMFIREIEFRHRVKDICPGGTFEKEETFDRRATVLITGAKLLESARVR